MATSSRTDRVRRVAFGAALSCAALALSYLEAILPLSLLIPLPGLRLGLSNLAVMFAFFSAKPSDAAAVLSSKILLSFFLFGSPVSLLLSSAGGILSFLWLFAAKALSKKEHLSFAGASVISALLHSAGQLIAASAIYGGSVFTYLPVLLSASTVTGFLTGVIMNLIYIRINKLTYEKIN